MTDITMNKKWRASPEVLSSKINKEAILMSFEAESYFGLDPVGSRIWELLLDQTTTTNELVFQLTQEYEINEITCKKDVLSFLDDMSSKKLILQVN